MRWIGFFISIIIFLLPALASAQPSLEEIIPRIKHGLVTIRSQERPLRQSQIYDPYNFFFQAQLPPGRGSYPIGSGFVMPDGIHVATSFRQLDGANALQIISDQGKVYDAQLLGADASLDLAILRIKNAKGLTGLDFGNSNQARLGDNLLIFGRSVRLMVIKANLSSTENAEGSFGRHWLIDSPTHPGVSGGPVVDSRGRVVGMAAYNPEGPPQLGVVLPSALMISGSQQLIKNGKLSKAWLGIVPKNLTSLDDLDHLRTAAIKGGVRVENLIVDGPAAKAGLQIGDLIMAIGEHTILQLSDLNAFLDSHKPGERLPLKIHRGNKGSLQLPLELGELPSAQDLPLASQLL